MWYYYVFMGQTQRNAVTSFVLWKHRVCVCAKCLLKKTKQKYRLEASRWYRFGNHHQVNANCRPFMTHTHTHPHIVSQMYSFWNGQCVRMTCICFNIIASNRPCIQIVSNVCSMFIVHYAVSQSVITYTRPLIHL